MRRHLLAALLIFAPGCAGSGAFERQAPTATNPDGDPPASVMLREVGSALSATVVGAPIGDLLIGAGAAVSMFAGGRRYMRKRREAKKGR